MLDTATNHDASVAAETDPNSPATFADVDRRRHCLGCDRPRERMRRLKRTRRKRIQTKKLSHKYVEDDARTGERTTARAHRTNDGNEAAVRSPTLASRRIEVR